jgi:uncharacterized protein YgbK (DUF1537 family)
MKTENKTKQIMVNVSDESKTKINEYKEQLELTDKEFIAIALTVFAAAKYDDVKDVIEKFTIEKQKAKIEARLAKITSQLEKAKGELEAVGTETSDEVEPESETSEEEEVLYNSADEEEEAIA